jgi:hypothetical protein
MNEVCKESAATLKNTNMSDASRTERSIKSATLFEILGGYGEAV